MFRIETDPLASQDDLPPEILRRLQVEELWARRDVLAELMNTERLQVYSRRRADLLTGCASAGFRSKPAKLSTTVMPIKPRTFCAPVALFTQNSRT
jgi:hypothetical protein